MLRKLYDWVIGLASRPAADWYMGIVSFSESSFFPVPPDVMLLPMALARPDRVWRLAAICTITSVAGGIVGYLIGSLLYDSVGQWIIAIYGYGARMEEFRQLYAHWGAWIILLKGLTPIPYKLVTIASGFAGYDFHWFVVLSLITRGARFYVLAFLIDRWGLQARDFIEKRLGLVTLGLLAIIIGGFVLAAKVI